MHHDGAGLRVNWLDWLSLTLAIVGALNWGLVGLAALYELYFAYQLRVAESRDTETPAR